jgi:hypothetical protein
VTDGRRALTRRPRLTERVVGALGVIEQLATADLEGIGGDGEYAGYTEDELDAAIVWLRMTVARERRRLARRGDSK